MLKLCARIYMIPILDGDDETYTRPEHLPLEPGDRLMGAPGGGLRLFPESRLGYLPADSRPTLAELAARMHPLLDLPNEMVLVSHGDPVLTHGREVLARVVDLGRR